MWVAPLVSSSVLPLDQQQWCRWRALQGELVLSSSHDTAPTPECPISEIQGAITMQVCWLVMHCQSNTNILATARLPRLRAAVSGIQSKSARQQCFCYRMQLACVACKWLRVQVRHQRARFVPLSAHARLHLHCKRPTVWCIRRSPAPATNHASNSQRVC